MVKIILGNRKTNYPLKIPITDTLYYKKYTYCFIYILYPRRDENLLTEKLALFFNFLENFPFDISSLKNGEILFFLDRKFLFLDIDLNKNSISNNKKKV